MKSVSTEDVRHRRRLAASIKESLRELRGQLSLLNHQVGGRLALKDIDLDCLELIELYGPLSPTELARRASLHPATLTGVLDRLQKGGWVVRERDPAGPDRRAVTVRALKDRNAEMYKLYSGMNASMDELCAGYDAAQLAVIADFLSRTTEAGRRATDDLAAAD